jgi:ABC-2 type transport system ATP-binding protein
LTWGRDRHIAGQGGGRRAAALLDAFALTDAGDRQVKGYSGGMRRRLDIAASLVVTPDLLFLDEPTTGLDPRNRQALWEVIQDLVAGGTTLLLTTQYLEEADHLADDIAVIDHGRLIARGTSDQLKDRTGGDVVEVVVHERAQLPIADEVLSHASAAAAARGSCGVRLERTR